MERYDHAVVLDTVDCVLDTVVDVEDHSKSFQVGWGLVSSNLVHNS